MSALLQVGDRVYCSGPGGSWAQDLGVVAAIEPTPSGREVAIIAWDTGDVDQVTLLGEPDGTCGPIGATPNGERWSLERTARQLAACLEEPS